MSRHRRKDPVLVAILLLLILTACGRCGEHMLFGVTLGNHIVSRVDPSRANIVEKSVNAYARQSANDFDREELEGYLLAWTQRRTWLDRLKKVVHIKKPVPDGMIDGWGNLVESKGDANRYHVIGLDIDPDHDPIDTPLGRIYRTKNPDRFVVRRNRSWYLYDRRDRLLSPGGDFLFAQRDTIYTGYGDVAISREASGASVTASEYATHRLMKLDYPRGSARNDLRTGLDYSLRRDTLFQSLVQRNGAHHAKTDAFRSISKVIEAGSPSQADNYQRPGSNWTITVPPGSTRTLKLPPGSTGTITVCSQTEQGTRCHCLREGFSTLTQPVASEEVERGHGWPYDDFLAALVANPT